MDKILSNKVISVTAHKKSLKTKAYGRMNRNFFRAHISGEDKTPKSTNHVGNFDEVLHKKIMKKPGKKLIRLKPGQDSYIAKNVTVRDCGDYKSGRVEETLSFENAGRDGQAGGVTPEHIDRYFRIKELKPIDEDNTLATSQGGSEYLLESTGKQYEGYREEDFAEERRSDTDLFLNGQSNWMDDDEPSRNPLTWQPHLPEVTRHFSDMKVQNETANGYLEEERKSDTNLFLDGESSWMDRDDESSTNPMDWDCHFPELKTK